MDEKKCFDIDKAREIARNMPNNHTGNRARRVIEDCCNEIEQTKESFVLFSLRLTIRLVDAYSHLDLNNVTKAQTTLDSIQEAINDKIEGLRDGQ